MLGFVLRAAKPLRKSSSYLLLYNYLVRPYLEYASQVWNPHYTIYKNAIEAVQKRFLRALHYRMAHAPLSYGKLLERYKLKSLTSRRNAQDAIALFNICRGHYNCPELLEHIGFRAPTYRTRTASLFAVPAASSNAGVRAPLRRMCQMYNNDLVSVDIFNNSRANFKLKVNLLLWSITYFRSSS